MKSHLTPIVLVSIFVLSASAVLNYTSSKNPRNEAAERGCTITMEGYIKKDTTGSIPKLLFVSKDNIAFQPIIEAGNFSLTENVHVEVCASAINTTDSTHRTIHINKVVFLP